MSTPRRDEDSDAGIRASARLLPDPCPPPFGKNSVAIGQVVRLIEQMLADEVGVARLAAQQSVPMPEDLA